MKKFILLTIPLMATSLLASCNNDNTYTMTFIGTHCTADNKDTYEKDKSISFTITPDEGYILPKNKSEINVEGIDIYDYKLYTDTGKATFFCTITSNVKVSIVANPPASTTYSITIITEGVNLRDNIIDLNKEFYESLISIYNSEKVLVALKSVTYKNNPSRDICNDCEFKLNPDMTSANIKIKTDYVADDLLIDVEIGEPGPEIHEVSVTGDKVKITFSKQSEEYYRGTIGVINETDMLAGKTSSLESVVWKNRHYSIKNICSYDVDENDYQSAEIIIPLAALYYDDIEITVKVIDKQDLWYLNNSYLNNLKDSDITKDGGEIQTLKVNGLDHQVRLIGINQDKDEKGKQIHTTWEFVNLISDSNGDSLAVQWNDADGEGFFIYSSHDYPNSTIRKALNGTGNALNFFWAQKGETSWSDDYKDTVLNTIDNENPCLVDIMKSPSKPVSTRDIPKPSTTVWGETTINDKLFLLSPKEVGYIDATQETTTFTYKYYEGHTAQNDNYRIKRQINATTEFTNYSSINVDARRLYDSTVNNYAGYNDLTNGSWSWFRSPYQSNTSSAWTLSVSQLNKEPTIVQYSTASMAFAVAPCFCI